MCSVDVNFRRLINLAFGHRYGDMKRADLRDDLTTGKRPHEQPTKQQKAKE